MDRHPIQPPDDIEFHTVDGLFVKVMVLEKEGMIVPQHVHAYDHGSFVARGSVRVWAGEALPLDYKAPAMIHIAAGVKHTFFSLEDDTIVCCMHNLHGKDAVSVSEEHQLVGV